MTRSTTNSSSEKQGSLPKVGYWRRDLAGMRQRRLRAAELFGHGATQAEVARTLQVSRQAASVWHARLQTGGTTALAGAGREGRRPQLSAEQRAAIDQALRQGARAHGFATDWWTLARVAQVLQRLTGVRHHPGHVWRVLRQLRWSLQRPARPSAGARRGGDPPLGRHRLATDPPKRPAAQGPDRVLGSARRLAAAGGAPDLGAGRVHARAGAPLQLAAGEHRRGPARRLPGRWRPAGGPPA
jgi:transposase